MAIYAITEPENINIEPTGEVALNGVFFYKHDRVTGQLILARSISDQKGAVVYSVNNIEFVDPLNPNISKLAKFMSMQNLHVELLPFFATRIPIHTEDGEPAELSIRHAPDIISIARPAMIWPERDGPYAD